MVSLSRKEKFTFDVRLVFVGGIVGIIVKFFQNPIMAYFVGAEGLGYWSLTLVFSGLLALVGGWFCTGVPKFVAEYKEDKNNCETLVWCGIFNAMISGIICMVILIALSDLIAYIFNMPVLSVLLKIIAVQLPFSFVYRIFLAVHQGFRNMKIYAGIGIILNIFTLLLCILFLIHGFEVIGIALATVLGTIIILMLMLIISKDFININFQNYRKHTKNLAFYGITGLVASIMGMMYLWYAVAPLIGYLLTPQQLGYYSVAYGLVMMLGIVSTPIYDVAYPAVSEFWSKHDYTAVKKTIDKSMKYVAVVLFNLGILIIFFIQDVILLLYSPDFLAVLPPLFILLIGKLGSGIERAVAIYTSIGHPEVGLKGNIIPVILCLPLNYVLILSYGINGAAVATAICMLITVAVNLYYIKKLTHVKYDFIWFSKLILFFVVCVGLFYISNRVVDHLVVGVILAPLFFVIVWKYLLTKEDRLQFLTWFKFR